MAYHDPDNPVVAAIPGDAWTHERWTVDGTSYHQVACLLIRADGSVETVLADELDTPIRRNT